MQDEIKLLVTDLDGTLLGMSSELPHYALFGKMVDELRRESGTQWVICTGRTLTSCLRFLHPMMAVGAIPDYVVVNHTHVYGLEGSQHKAHMWWSLRIGFDAWIERLRAISAIKEWYRMIHRGVLRCLSAKLERGSLLLRFETDDDSQVVAQLLKTKAQSLRAVAVFEFFREVQVRRVSFSKAVSVVELGKRLGVDKKNILTIGNAYNDLSMLDGSVSGMTGCPENAEPKVVETVHLAEGHIARESFLDGVLEVMNAYRTGTVNSRLPYGWEPAMSRKILSRAKGHEDHDRLVTWKKMVGTAVIVYTVLLALASVGMLPYVSGLVLKPYLIFVRLLQKVLSCLGG